jgi:hypothetical protein
VKQISQALISQEDGWTLDVDCKSREALSDLGYLNVQFEPFTAFMDRKTAVQV